MSKSRVFENANPMSVKSIRFRDLSVFDPTLKSELLEAVDRVLTHGQIMLGPEVVQLEEAVASYCGTKYCVGVSSGTDALYVALRSIGIGPGDEVITTPLSWIATLNAIHVCGAEPVFVDVGEDLNLNVDLLEQAITPRTKAIVPVHFTGLLCDMVKLSAIAKKHGIVVIEDAAQAFGAHMEGTHAGAFSEVAAFSFNPMKVLPAYGEAGAVVTEDPELYEKLLALRYLGTMDREYCHYPSLNAKIDTIQAAMMLVSLKYFERNLNRRLEIADYYSSALDGVVKCPQVYRGTDRPSVFFDYTIVADQRDELKAYLESRGIEVKIKHPILMPDQPGYAHLEKPFLPVAERLVGQILSLPIHEKLTQEDLDYVVDSVKSVYESGVRRDSN